MIRDALTETKTARDIARKSGVRLSAAPEGPGDPSRGLFGEYSQVDIPAPLTHSQYGSVIDFPAEVEFAFPESVSTGSTTDDFNGRPRSRLARDAHWNGIDEVRLVVTVTEAATAPAGASVYITIWRDTFWGLDPLTVDFVAVTFEVEAPSAPLDAVGMHVTEWRRIDWPPEAVSPSGTRPALVQWYVDNPLESTGEAGIGLCQLQARGDPA